MTINQAVAASGGGRTHLYKAINSGVLKSFWHEGRRLINRSDLMRWVEAGRKLES